MWFESCTTVRCITIGRSRLLAVAADPFVISKIMDDVQIGNKSDGCVIFDNPRINDEGWIEYYDLRLESYEMNAKVKVENALYGVSIWEFFKELDDNWSGWEDSKSWRALEDEFRLEATISKTGHVNLCFILNSNNYVWHAIANIQIDAGQLSQLSRGINRFFRIDGSI
jgi:hypothetical protein